MFRKHESSFAWKAGLLAVLVHVLLVGVLLFSFQWKAAHSVVSVSDVMLWDDLPSKSQPLPKPEPKIEPKPQPEPPKPIPEIKKEPEPVEVKPEPEVPKVDIELENKKKKAEEEKKKKLEEEKKKAEERKKAEEAEKKRLAEEKKRQEIERQKMLEAIKEAAREEALDPNKEKRVQEALEALQKMNKEDLGEANKEGAMAASQGVVDEYIAKIQAKVRGHVNKSLCADGNPEPSFKISLLPNGEFSGSPILSKSSGSKACDDAVERAIIASEPFPVPQAPDAMARFRNLNLKFKPNGD
ncbi:MAG TPA: cell envelope integrity protein TolA [Methylophilaceae bacterium]|nr:cell envelope integrity protein TolA [Methylophilaceae bacterium]